MEYERFRDAVCQLPAFSLRDAVTLSGQSTPSISVHLNRWVRTGRLERLRRGLYTLNTHDRQAPLTKAYLASLLVEPSYLSGVWLLSQLSVIPEAAFTITCATRGRRVRFENSYGRFAYYRLPEKAWFGFSSKETEGYYALYASPEKALLDSIYWSGETWDEKRFQQERLDANRLKTRRLERFAARWGIPKLRDSVDGFIRYKEAPCPTW